VLTPPMKAEQHGPICIAYLTEVVVSGRCLWLAEERLIPFEAGRYVSDADYGPYSFHSV